MKHFVRITRKPACAQIDIGEVLDALSKILQVVGTALVTKEQTSGDPYDW